MTIDPAALSLAARGDLSALSPAEKARHYVATCERLGLNPHTAPFQYLRLNGKEVLYATRGATDQLAELHGLTRTLVDGPKVIDLAGTKLVYCVCKVVHPNGRFETATATVPLVDPVNVLMRCECVPLDTEILTRRGFKRHDEVQIGEEVLAYDVAHDVCRWTPMQNRTVYPDAPVSRFHTDHNFSVRCTPNHSWAMEVPARTSKGRALVEARDTKTHHKLILAAVCPEGDHPLTPELAAVLGWVMCDGTIKRVGNYVRLSVSQSKQNRVKEIRELFMRAGLHPREDVGQPTVRTFPTGATYECLPQHWFSLNVAESRAVLAAAGIEGPGDLPRLVTRLSPAARRAMLDAMMAADGTAAGRFGKKRKPGVMEAWQILCALEGVALGKMGRSSVGDVPVQTMMKTRYVAGSNLKLTPDGSTAVWCPTTQYGTWVARQDGRVFITGNTKAKRRATLSILGLAPLDETVADTAVDGGSVISAEDLDRALAELHGDPKPPTGGGGGGAPPAATDVAGEPAPAPATPPGALALLDRELGKLPVSSAGALRVARTWWSHREAFVGAGLVEEGEAVVFAALRTRGVADVETFLTEAKDAPTARKSLARTRRPEGGILVQAVGS